MNGAHLLVDCLNQQGVTTIFGMPGGQTVSIYDALLKFPGIRHVLARNEHAGAFMADGYSRATGRPGVCLVTAGPGITNCVTGLGNAYSDSIPFLLISGQIKRSAIGKSRGYFHEMDNLGVTAPLTKWNASARSADEIPGLVQRAFHEMASGRPRPVHLDLPIDVSAEETSARPLPGTQGKTPVPDTAEIERAAALLRSAQRPLIIAGGGVASANACEELLSLARSVQAPVFMTPMGKGAISDDDPLAEGMLFQRLTSDLTKMKDNFSPLPAMADVVLAVGCRFSQVATGNWELPIPENLIQIDIDEDELGRNYPARVGICGDAKVALAEINEALDTQPHSGTVLWNARSPIPDGQRWQIKGFDLVPVMRRLLDRDAIVSCDVTRLYYMMLANFQTYQPRSFLQSSCFISLGTGFPGAIGAKAAYPDRQVVAIAGDGGFMMTSQELACAVQEKLNVVSIVINDSCLSAMKGIQNRSYGGRHTAVDLINPDFAKYAESFGALGLRVDEFSQFEPALREALDAGRPAVIDVRAPQTAE
ncbi:MAG: thiamine pyrophosphate-binding protein [Fuerstiella sp.]|nr:thiamine pyrophosphate-binding protein [Fuerstiella sp.]MCP4859524.1 thiamine pyrophosphate-binding protein [Fuerstiella sp.]